MKTKSIGSKSLVIWITGLPASGKTTLGSLLETELSEMEIPVTLLDGDVIRKSQYPGLGFTMNERKKHIRLIAEKAATLLESDRFVICCFVSPTEEIRQVARRVIGKNRFIEVYLSTPLSVCEERDPKGLYRKARRGEITDFTGLDSPYEPPNNPDIILDASESDPKTMSKKVLELAFNTENRSQRVEGSKGLRVKGSKSLRV